ncbi:MAG: alanine--tRNA ligase [Thermoplasmata archaeon]
MENDPLDLKIFHEKGFERRICKKCGAKFWSRVERDTCGEFPCDPYTFIGNPVMDKRLDFYQMMDYFLKFFEERGHKIINRYPVVPRWRKDVFLVNASIYDFQPHVTSGQVPPPANPLVVPQPCIRMVDIDDVAKTGRHLTSFIMLGHHAFNYPNDFKYWKDKTVEYSLEFLQSLGVNPDLVTFKEKPWIGGGNGGYAVEVIVAGLELATLVFMEFKEDSTGEVEIEGKRFVPMPLKVVDTGYGLERFVWSSSALPSVFDAIYGDTIDYVFSFLKISKPKNYNDIVRSFVSIENKERLEEELSKRMDKDSLHFIEILRKVHVIVDHTRTIVFMLNDGAVPSNSKTGYLARMIIRRYFRVLEDLGIVNYMKEIIKFQFNKFSRQLDEQMLPVILDIMDVEYERYRETLEKGKIVVDKMIKDNRVSLDDLITLYDSYGIQPELVAERAKTLGINLHIPENFRSLVASRHERQEIEIEEQKSFDFPPTIQLYYQDPYLKEFDANVLHSENGLLILDRTAFYPEGGGQPFDTGEIYCNGKIYKVKEVKKFGEVIVHYIDGNIDCKSVHGKIDWDRRYRLMKNHTATHILLYSCRKVLGKHIWQAGAQKEEELSRLDITHYKKITREELKEIENVAMNIIMENVNVETQWMERNDAERLYGFKLYEGGIPPGDRIRVVKIGEYDVEGCGGTHILRTGEIGFIKILKEERIQDGVSRIIFSAGKGALNIVHKNEDILYRTSEIIRVAPEELPNSVKRFFEEWKDLRKQKDRLESRIISLEMEKIKLNAKKLKGINFYKGSMENELIMKFVKNFNEENSILFIFGNNLGIIVDNTGLKILQKLNLKGKINKHMMIIENFDPEKVEKEIESALL